MFGKFIGFVFGFIGAATTAGLGYLEYECRTNGKFCEQSLFSETPETLEALLKQQERLATQQEQIGSKLDELGGGDERLVSAQTSIADLETRIVALENQVTDIELQEKRIKDIEGKITKTGTYGPIELDYSYTAEFPTGVFGSFEISLRGCQRAQRTVECAFIINNTANRDIQLDFNDYNRSVGYLPSGETISTVRTVLGGRSSTGVIRRTFPPNIPAQGSITFSNVNENIEGFPILRLTLDSIPGPKGYYEYKNVRFQ